MSRSTPAAPRPYRPIVFAADEREEFDHAQGPAFAFLMRRAFGLFVDVAVVGVAFASFAYRWAGADLIVPSLGAALLVLFLSEALTGTSLGKLIVRLHVRRSNGKSAGTARVFWRNAFRSVDVVVVGALVMLATQRRQRIGDKIADTVAGRSPLGPSATLAGVTILAALACGVAAFGDGAHTFGLLQSYARKALFLKGTV